MSSNIVVVRIEILRTYDDVVDYVIRELKKRPVCHYEGTKFSGVVLNLNEVEITDTLSTDDEMPRMFIRVRSFLEKF